MTMIHARWRNNAAILPGMALIMLTLASQSVAGPVLRVETDPQSPAIAFLSWDTEGGEQARMNLLRSGSVIRVCIAGEWLEAEKLQSEKLPSVSPSKGSRYRLSPADDITLTWTVAMHDADLSITLAGEGTGLDRVEAVELVFPLDPRMTATTVLPSKWADDGTLCLPALISAPDFGQMYLTAEGDTPDHRVTGRLEGSRDLPHLTVDFTLQLPVPGANTPVTLRLSPWVLPAPESLKDHAMWKAARRGWFNIFQCTAQWGDQKIPFSSPAGIQSNNVISDPCSMLLYAVADAALLIPELAPGVSAMEQVRYSIDWWLDQRMLESGEIIGYRGDYVDFMDTNASVLISAWDYVEATGDLDWLKRRIAKLERVAAFIAGRDIDGDGLFEAVQSGNAGTLIGPKRSCAAWDAINCGHKDAYCNALIYRAWLCTADLEAKLGRADQQARYRELAGRLKDAYAKTLVNPKTGYVAWWKSEDGELHDFASPVVNGIAIRYGLIDANQGRKILENLRAKMHEAGFNRPELGLPVTLVPIPREDYLIEYPDGIAGCPTRDDGTDTFGIYLNGGIIVFGTLDFLQAHYMLGEDEHADAIIRAMLRRQNEGAYPNGGGFQNGIVNHYPKGAEVTNWQGKTCGYEGYHSCSFTFLQSVLLREPEFRRRLLRPLR
jgi:hypothetical protein